MKKSRLVSLTIVGAAIGTATLRAQTPVGDPPRAALSAVSREAADGWAWANEGVDDFVPWPLERSRDALRARNGKFVVVFGYLTVSAKALIVFPSFEASKSGSLEGALILLPDDSPALRWLFPLRHSEGYYAVGGVLTCSASGPSFGELSKVTFAMKRDELPAVPIVKLFGRIEWPASCPNGHRIRAVPRLIEGQARLSSLYQQGEAFGGGDVGHPWHPGLSYVCDQCRTITDTGKHWYALTEGFGVERSR
ncbi:MAG: hypothetical protein NTV51_10960 [Verrucomicrobia bacterium]|nr:hypothetical protein [Verrucomicrobiota bacterium]